MPCKSNFQCRVRRPLFALVLLAMCSTIAVAASDAPEANETQREALAMQAEQGGSSAKSVSEKESSNGPVLLVPVVLAVLALVAVSRRRES